MKKVKEKGTRKSLTTHPEVLKEFASAIISQAIKDLKHPSYADSTKRFIDSKELEIYTEVLKIDANALREAIKNLPEKTRKPRKVKEVV